MGSQQFLTSETPEIVINRARGELVIRGWHRNEILVRCDQSGHVQQIENGFAFTFEDDATIQLPLGTTLRIGEVDGDLALASVMGSINIGKVRGSADVREVGPLRIEGVDGDISIRVVRGDLLCRRCG